MQNYDLVLLDNIQWLDDLSVQILQKRLEEESIKPQTLILTTTEMPAVIRQKQMLTPFFAAAEFNSG